MECCRLVLLQTACPVSILSAPAAQRRPLHSVSRAMAQTVAFQTAAPALLATANHQQRSIAYFSAHKIAQPATPTLLIPLVTRALQTIRCRLLQTRPHKYVSVRVAITLMRQQVSACLAQISALVPSALLTVFLACNVSVRQVPPLRASSLKTVLVRHSTLNHRLQAVLRQNVSPFAQATALLAQTPKSAPAA
jgi:hypothetical protein